MNRIRKPVRIVPQGLGREVRIASGDRLLRKDPGNLYGQKVFVAF
jgi:hypothetical protein